MRRPHAEFLAGLIASRGRGIAYHPQKLSALGSLSQKTSIQMITLTARFRLYQ